MPKGLCVLVVCGNARQASYIEHIIREQLDAAVVQSLASGEQALALVDDSVDAIVIDDQITDMAVATFLQQIKSSAKAPPVIVLSSSNDPATAADILQNGARDVLLRDYDLKRALPVLLRRAGEECLLRRNFDIKDAQYRALLEETIDGIYILAGNNFVYVNQRFEQMFGYMRSEILGHSFDFQRLIAPESLDMIRDRAERAARGDALEPHYEFVALNARNERFDVGVSVAYIEYNSEPATLGIIQDITERRAFERTLLRRNRELAVLNDIAATVNRSLDLGTVLDIAAERLMSVMRVSAAGISLVDAKRGVLEGHVFRGVTDVFRRHLRAIPLGSGIMGSVATTGELVVVDDIRTDPRLHISEVRGTGFVSTVAVPIKAQDRVLGVAVCFSDHPRVFSGDELDLLTHIGNQIGTAVDKAQMHERLKATIRRLVALDEIARLIGGTLDAREVFALAATQLRRLVGSDRVSVALYDPVNDYFDMHYLSVEGVEKEPSQPTRSREGSAMGIAIESQHAIVVDLAQAKGEYERHLAGLGLQTFAAVPIIVERTPVGVLSLSWFASAAVSEDALEVLNALAAHLAVAIKNARLFSELESTLLELRATQEKLVQAGKLEALGELAAGVAHDFNNVLGAILGRAQLLKKYLQNDELRKNVDVIERAALDGAATVRRIQEFSRSQREVDYEPVHIASVVNDAVEYAQPRWLDRPARDGIHIDLVVDHQSTPAVSGNAQELREVVTNLIHNACDAMPQGGALRIRTSVQDDRVAIDILDSGNGIAADVRSRIFDPFFTTKGVRGSGLGLSVSYSIVQQHQGTIEVDSEVGVGTRFVILLPALQQTALVEAVAPLRDVASTDVARILVIDDEEAIREVLEDILRTGEHHVVVACDGEQGLACFDAEPFDMVFTDLGMPGMSGFDVAREVKRRKPHVPVGLLTGWGSSIDEKEMRASGVDLLVPKPFKFDEVMDLVQSALRLLRS